MRSSLIGLLLFCSTPVSALADVALYSDVGSQVGRSFHVDWLTDVGPGHQTSYGGPRDPHSFVQLGLREFRRMSSSRVGGG